ncbi:putative selenate ABC transporter substrate-binding protein [bacterium]|nr:MAG: putative selenate ABC transporter substrate-binding protein [bacterium]
MLINQQAGKTALKFKFFFVLFIAVMFLSACSSQSAVPTEPAQPTSAEVQPFVISAIPDQDPEKLNRLYGSLAAYLSERLGVPVEYKAVTDYTASVTALKVGDLDMVWYGGLTGVQARLQVPGAQAILQRNIDAEFHSVFIANSSSDLAPFEDISGLASLKDHSFTFGSESSTSGRLMPQYFLKQAGVTLQDFHGEPGFSGSHDKTIQLVEAGTYQAGVVNEQVWKTRTQNNEVDLTKVKVLWTTPAYFDYHWVIRPGVAERYGADFLANLKNAFMALDATDPQQKEILDLFGATKFVETQNSNYDKIEEVARELGKIQ